MLFIFFIKLKVFAEFSYAFRTSKLLNNNINMLLNGINPAL